MSWRLFPRRRPSDLGAAIVTRSLRASAEEYAGLLAEGSEITDCDREFIAPFRHLIPQALQRRGLCLDQIPGGWRIIRSPFPALAVVPAECTVCRASWFSCGHGVGVEVAVNWDEPTERVINRG